MTTTTTITTLVALAALATACATNAGPNPGGASRESAEATTPTEPSGASGGGAGGGGGDGDPAATKCAEPTGTYRDTRTTKIVTGGPDAPCNVGTYLDPSHRFEAGLHDLPGCTSERRTSPDGCTRELELIRETSTCLEKIVFSEDLSTYTGTVVCTGTYSGVDEDGPLECRTVVEGKRNP